MAITMRHEKSFLGNLLIGVALAVALHFLVPEGGLLERFLANFAGDTTIRVAGMLDAFDWYRNYFGPRNASGHLAPIVIVDINDETYRLWGEPQQTPRDKLALLLKKSLDGGAAVVVVDVDLARAGPDVAADQALVNLLAAEQQAATAARRPSRVVLTRRLVKASGDESSWMRKLYFEGQPGRPTPLIGTATFVVDNDRIVRRWRLVETACRDGQGFAAYSVQVVVAAALFGQQAVSQIQKGTDAFEKVACAKGPNQVQEAEALTLSPTFAIPLDDESSVSRMRFEFNWDRDRMMGQLKELPGFNQYVLSRLPAGLVLSASDPAAQRAFTNVIALIGATHYDTLDNHETSVGQMPGILLEANAIYSLLDHGVMESPPTWLKVLLELLGIVLLADVFTFLSLRYTFWVGLIVIGIALFPIALVLFRYGLWFDYATPLLGPVAHQFFERRLHAT